MFRHRRTKENGSSSAPGPGPLRTCRKNKTQELPVWEYDVARDIVIGNVYYHQVRGRDVTEAEALRRAETWLSEIHPDDAGSHRHLVPGDATADAAGFYQSEFRIRAATGEYKWLLHRGRVVERAPDGAPCKVMGISLRYRCPQADGNSLARESEERCRGELEFAAMGVALVAPDSRVDAS